MANTNVYTGANGLLVITPDDELDAPTIINHKEYGIADSTAVGRVVNVDVCIRTDLEEFHEIGHRHAVSLHPGNIHISGTIGRAFINGSLLMLLMGRSGSGTGLSAEPFAQPRMSLMLDHHDPVVPTKLSRITLFDVMLQNWNYHMPDDDFVLEQVTFKALSIASNDLEDGSNVSVTFK